MLQRTDPKKGEGRVRSWAKERKKWSKEGVRAEISGDAILLRLLLRMLELREVDGG